MTYRWNTPFSLEHQTESRHLRRFETHEYAAAKAIVEALTAAKFKVSLTPKSAGIGCGVSHYELILVTSGNDWERAEQFTDATRLMYPDRTW